MSHTHHPSQAAAAAWWAGSKHKYAQRLIPKAKLAERRRRSGGHADPLSHHPHHQVGPWPHAAPAVPVASDLRPKWGQVYDQLDIGSCTANALAGVIRYLCLMLFGVHFDPSVLWLYVKERLLGAPHQPLTDSGSDVAYGLTWATNVGVIPESLWAYDPSKVNVVPPASLDTTAADHKISGAYDLTAGAKTPAAVLANVQSALSKGYPVLLAFEVYSSFMSDAVAQTGVVPVPNVNTEQLEGGHEVVIVGYIPSSDQYIVANSWSASWGMNGFCLFPGALLANLKVAMEFLAFTNVVIKPTPTPTPTPIPAPTPTPTPTPQPTPSPSPADINKVVDAVNAAQTLASAALNAASAATAAVNAATTAANAAAVAAKRASDAALTAVNAAKVLQATKH